MNIKLKPTMIQPEVKYPARASTGLQRVWCERKTDDCAYIIRGECSGQYDVDGELIADCLKGVGATYNPRQEIIICFALSLKKAREAVYALLEDENANT